jgi:hypothetical protein
MSSGEVVVSAQHHQNALRIAIKMQTMYGQAIAVGNLGALALKKEDIGTSRTCFEQVSLQTLNYNLFLRTCLITDCDLKQVFHCFLCFLYCSINVQSPFNLLLIFRLNLFLNKHLQLVRSLSDSAAEIKAWEMVITIAL